MAENNATLNVKIRVGVAILRMSQWMMTNRPTLMLKEMKATLMQTMRRRMRRCSTLVQAETSEDEDGGDGEAVMVLVSAGEAMAHNKPTRTLQDRLNQEPLRDRTHKALPHNSRLPQPPQDRLVISNKALE